MCIGFGCFSSGKRGHLSEIAQHTVYHTVCRLGDPATDRHLLIFLHIRDESDLDEGLWEFGIAAQGEHLVLTGACVPSRCPTDLTAHAIREQLSGIRSTGEGRRVLW